MKLGIGVPMTNVHSKKGGGGYIQRLRREICFQFFKSTRSPNELNSRTNNEFVRDIVECMTTVD